MIKLYRFASLSLFSLCLISHAACASQMVKPWYVSVDAGVFEGMFDAQYNDLTDVLPQNIRQTVQQYGYTGGIAVGYSALVANQYLLGGELQGSFATNKAYFATGASNTAFTDKLSVNGNLDLTFVPGLLMTDTLAIYGKVGLSLAQIQAKLNSPTGYNPTFASTNNTNNVLGVALGLGIKKYIGSHAACFAEYVYHDYNNVSFSAFQNFSASYSHAAHVYSQALVVGASYFC